MNNELQILLATMNQTSDAVLDKMNIRSNTIVCNQNNTLFKKNVYKKNGYIVEWYDLAEKGVGLNRNNALLRASSDFCLIADDDVVYMDGYYDTVLNAFSKNPKADVILFNIYSDSKKRFVCKKVMKINNFNCGRFGGVRIAFRRKKIIKNSISFNLLFGGGAQYGSGEDVMFIRDCIRKGLKVIAVPDYILSLSEDRESSWFNGYNEKFFRDLGASYVYHYKKLAYIFAIIQLTRKKKVWLKTVKKSDAKKWVKLGIKEFYQI